MRTIELTKGYNTIIDDEDYEHLSQFKWHVTLEHHGLMPYATTGGGRTSPRNRMHRLIMDAPKGMVVDHINHDTLDNRKENLRLCTRSQNNRNCIGKRGRFSKYKGVVYVKWKKEKKWQAQIRIGLKTHWLGYHLTEEEAARAYDKAALKFSGEFAYINFPKKLLAAAKHS